MIVACCLHRWGYKHGYGEDDLRITIDGIADNGTNAFGDSLCRMPIDNEIDALYMAEAA